MTSKRRWGLGLAAVAAMALAAVGAAYLIAALRMPYDAPLARMYRTEADLAFLAKAVDTYKRDNGQYPPAGADGLRRATDHLSRHANYVPEGPPPDSWGHYYYYVPATQYAEPESAALKCGDARSSAARSSAAYCAPDTYQLYSAGADGDPGLDAAEGRRDNICNWDRSKPWRAAYRDLNRAFMRQTGDRPSK